MSLGNRWTREAWWPEGIVLDLVIMNKDFSQAHPFLKSFQSHCLTPDVSGMDTPVRQEIVQGTPGGWHTGMDPDSSQASEQWKWHLFRLPHSVLILTFQCLKQPSYTSATALGDLPQRISNSSEVLAVKIKKKMVKKRGGGGKSFQSDIVVSVSVLVLWNTCVEVPLATEVL